MFWNATPIVVLISISELCFRNSRKQNILITQSGIAASKFIKRVIVLKNYIILRVPKFNGIINYEKILLLVLGLVFQQVNLKFSSSR